VYLGGPGVSISGEDAIEIARERRGAAVAPRLVPVEASSLVALAMLEADGLLTIAAVAMPGSAPVVRLMMYPDGPRLGPDRIVASLAGAFERLAGVIDDIPAARRLLLG
jgi:L-seryl-tRNA(Ser) seleniumtransferase